MQCASNNAFRRTVHTHITQYTEFRRSVKSLIYPKLSSMRCHLTSAYTGLIFSCTCHSNKLGGRYVDPFLLFSIGFGLDYDDTGREVASNSFTFLYCTLDRLLPNYVYCW